MTSNELRRKFLEFFEKEGHFVVPSSSLIPTDPSVLFTTAGMQQFKEYFLGEKPPHGNKVASCQKCFRTSDIDEVGDASHLTFFEMLGNFSFGEYGKEKAIKLAKEFLDFIDIKIDYVTVFWGDSAVPRDEESTQAWEKLGFSEKEGNLKFGGREDNFWGPAGEEGPCGPTTEIYINGVEIWNLVFNEYYRAQDKALTPLKQKGVDTGMGLERLAMVAQGKTNVFETDLFSSILQEIKKYTGSTGVDSGVDLKAERIIADHVKGAVFLISEGIFPSNVERGYVLRRILRRAIRYGKLLGLAEQLLILLAQKVVEIYKDVYPELKSKETDILTVIQNEEEKFKKTLDEGLSQFEKLLKLKIKNEKLKIIAGEEAFNLYQSYGFPLELIQELAKEKKFDVDKNEFNKAFEKHQEISRAGAKGKFGGGGELSPKLHTATHLLHAALRQVLGEHVQQMGSDITSERTRFDFSHQQKMTPQELEKVEDSVNQKIKDGLEVKKEEMSYEEAIKSGALAFFKEKYPVKVAVYAIGNFSKEICAGPHVNKTSELGRFKIIKEESSGAGVRRIRAVLE